MKSRKHEKAFTCALSMYIFSPISSKDSNQQHSDHKFTSFSILQTTTSLILSSQSQKDDLEKCAGSITDLFVLLGLLPPPPAFQCLSLQPMIHQRVQGLPQHQVPVMKTPHTCIRKENRDIYHIDKILCVIAFENDKIMKSSGRFRGFFVLFFFSIDIFKNGTNSLIERPK